MEGATHFFVLKRHFNFKILLLIQLISNWALCRTIRIGNSTVSRGIWDKYRE